jgi:hypothetical protein
MRNIFRPRWRWWSGCVWRGGGGVGKVILITTAAVLGEKATMGSVWVQLVVGDDDNITGGCLTEVPPQSPMARNVSSALARPTTAKPKTATMERAILQQYQWTMQAEFRLR